MNLLKFISNEYYEDYFVKSTPRSRTHLVTIDKKESTIHCDCEDFKYRKENLKFGGALLEDTSNHCKHMKWVMKVRSVINDGKTS